MDSERWYHYYNGANWKPLTEKGRGLRLRASIKRSARDLTLSKHGVLSSRVGTCLPLSETKIWGSCLFKCQRMRQCCLEQIDPRALRPEFAEAAAMV